MDRYLYVYSGATLYKTYDISSDLGHFIYWRDDKRQEIYNVETQEDKYISAIYKPIFNFQFGDIDLEKLQEIRDLQDLGLDFKLKIGAKTHDVILSKSTKTLYHPASTNIQLVISFISLNSFNSPTLDTYSYIDSIYNSDKNIGLNGSIYINIYSYDLNKVYVYADGGVLVSYMQDDVVYSETYCNSSMVHSAIRNGENVIKLTGVTTLSKILIWGE